MNYQIGEVDYDYGMYHNRVRKYVIVRFDEEERTRRNKIVKVMIPIWHQVKGFKPEIGLDNITRDLNINI